MVSYKSFISTFFLCLSFFSLFLFFFFFLTADLAKFLLNFNFFTEDFSLSLTLVLAKTPVANCPMRGQKEQVKKKKTVLKVTYRAWMRQNSAPSYQPRGQLRTALVPRLLPPPYDLGGSAGLFSPRWILVQHRTSLLTLSHTLEWKKKVKLSRRSSKIYW